MDLVRLAIQRPVGVVVAVLIVVMFGLIGVGAIPIQLTPTVDRPIITVTTNWPGRSPQEVVDEITKEQEERLKNVSNLKSMRSLSSEGSASITLEYYIGSDIDRASQEVSDALRQVPEYPDEVDEPNIADTSGGPENAIAWIILDIDPDYLDEFEDFDISTLFDQVDREIRPFLERVGGVAEVNVYGGREREVRVLLDPSAMALRGLNHVDVFDALRGENRNVSAGTIAEGKRDYRVRVVGQFSEPEQVLGTIVAYRDGKPVYLRDIGTVELSYQKSRGFVRSLGQPCLAINVLRQTDANVVEVMAGVNEQIEQVRLDILPNLDDRVGPHLRLRQVYDETTYISSAIDLVLQNLWIGGILAGVVLLVFLRSVPATLVIALAIPISVIGTFLVLLGLGRTLNVISLAGLAFAVGMVVDNAIVVLENIDRHRAMGKTPATAAYDGAKEVWGAVLASTLTTAVVFIPILTIQEEAGQLFRDISLAIVGAVSLSLIVSLTVIPSASASWLGEVREPKSGFGRAVRSLGGLATLGTMLCETFGRVIRWMMGSWRGFTLRPLAIVVLTAASLLLSWVLMPPLDYLPAGNRNLVFGGLLLPPGQSVEARTELAERMEAMVGPYTLQELGEDGKLSDLPKIPYGYAPDPETGEMPAYEPVAIENFFIGAFGTQMFAGATSADERVVIPIGQVLTNTFNQLNGDIFGGASQASLFGMGATGGGTIDIEISGPNLEKVKAVAGQVFGTAAGIYGYGRVQPNPANFSLGQPEMRAEVNSVGRDLGLTTEGVGLAVRGLFDGVFVGDYQLDGEQVDLVMLPLGGRLEYIEKMLSVPIATPAGPVVPVDSVVDITRSIAPQEISRVEELPSVTINVRPPEGEPVGEVIAKIRNEIIAPLRESGQIDSTMRIRMEGTAAKLDEVQVAMFGMSADGPRTAGGAGSRVLWAAGGVAQFGGLALAIVTLVISIRRNQPWYAYGAVGLVLLGGIFLLLFGGLAASPALLTARFVWALAVVYLLMCALFESFLYPLVIMFTVPLAIVGGFAALAWVHAVSAADPTIAPQNLDVLTILGFVILVGIVVNNSILIVHQSLGFMDRNPMEDASADVGEAHEAIARATTTRIRPIFMGTLTSVGGMLPLVLFPGAGSEMYRGLGSVVVGGLLVSTFFTLLLTPLLFSLVIDMRVAAKRALTRRSDAASAPAPPERRQARDEAVIGDGVAQPAV
ncbi:MAG: efflux RND transporter permease subunit [Phycisphaera sp.]|nr:MAG: efflux RND transporter permease subunit [Phycisphaera sp.]